MYKNAKQMLFFKTALSHTVLIVLCFVHEYAEFQINLYSKVYISFKINYRIQFSSQTFLILIM